MLLVGSRAAIRLIIVIRFLRLLLVLIALLGPAGQTVAYAQPATAAAAITTGAHGKSDCEGLFSHTRVVESVPCRDLPLDCVGKMGCLQTSVLPDRAVLKRRSIVWQTIHYPDMVTPATGLTVKPEVFPPIA